MSATMLRVLRQVTRDRRTMAMLLIVPSVLMTLLRYVFDNEALFNSIAVPMLGIFPFITMFLLTSVTMLRERTSGTLERLLSTPLSKIDLLLGYGGAFALLAAVQAGVTCAVTYGFLGLETQGSVWQVVLIAVFDAVLGMSLGLFVSAFATTEFQAVQFMPAFVLPQILLCGLFTPRDQMSSTLEAVSNILPLSYAVEALQEVQQSAAWSSTLLRDAGVIAGFTVVALLLAAATLRRRTP